MRSPPPVFHGFSPVFGVTNFGLLTVVAVVAFFYGGDGGGGVADDGASQPAIPAGVRARGETQGGGGHEQRHFLRLDGAVHRPLSKGQVLR